jgi:chromosome segregation ATPase
MESKMERDGKMQDVREQTRRLMAEEFSKSQAYALYGFVQQQIVEFCHTKVDQRIFESYVKERFDRIDGRIDGLESRMDKLESRMYKLESRMYKLESRMYKLESRMDKLESRMDKLEARMDRLEAKMDRLEIRVSNLENQMAQVLSIVSLIAKKLDIAPST